jgi:hypothetical protein
VLKKWKACNTRVGLIRIKIQAEVHINLKLTNCLYHPSRPSNYRNTMITQRDSLTGRIVCHDQFYFPNGDVTFLVSGGKHRIDFQGIIHILNQQFEGKLFRVHRYFFERDSLFFKEKLPSLRDFELFPLEGVSSSDFALFLWVFYSP